MFYSEGTRMPSSCGKILETRDVFISNQKHQKSHLLYTAHILLLHSLLVKSMDFGARLPGFKTQLEGFPGGTAVKNLPANAGDTGSSPGLGRSHIPQSN